MADEIETKPEGASPQNEVEEDAEVNDAIDESQEEKTSQPDASQQQSNSASGTVPMSSLDGANDVMPPQISAAEAEARIPQKKDATLREFLGKMDDYAPIVRYAPVTVRRDRTDNDS